MANGRKERWLVRLWARRVSVLAATIIGAIAIGNSTLHTAEASQHNKLGLPRPGAPVEPANPAKMAFELPEKPSIAVLPFDNFTGDPKQEYISDGLTESIIAVLSTSPDLFVIARNSSFTYKAKPVRVQEVAEQLGVRYVLEGSVQREGDKILITAQLIDAISGVHLWAERYERQLDSVFDLQNDITQQILVEMHVNLTRGAANRQMLAKHGPRESISSRETPIAPG